MTASPHPAIRTVYVFPALYTVDAGRSASVTVKIQQQFGWSSALVVETIDADLLVAIEDLVVGLPGDAELSAKNGHLFAFA